MPIFRWVTIERMTLTLAIPRLRSRTKGWMVEVISFSTDRESRDSPAEEKPRNPQLAPLLLDDTSSGESIDSRSICRTPSSDIENKLGLSNPLGWMPRDRKETLNLPEQIKEKRHFL